METSDNRNNIKILCEIILKKDPELFAKIREMKLSAITNRGALADMLTGIIREKLVEWNIDIQSFESMTTKVNSLSTMYSLIETIQSEYDIEDDKLNNIKEMLSKDIRNVNELSDCLKIITDLLSELKTRVIQYNINSERRISMYQPLQDFASDLYNILCIVKRNLDNFQERDVSDMDVILTGYMKQLLESSIVIANYPPRTIKKGTVSKAGTHFKACIKCLIESEKLFSKDEIKPYFLSDGDLRDFIRTKELKSDCLIKYVPCNSKPNIWDLKSMLWSPSERLNKDRRKSDRITNQKAIIMFLFKACATPYLFGQLKVNICLYSDTVVSIVHTNQEIEALITLFWDDYFRQNRTAFLDTGSFICKDSVAVEEFVEAVSRYFEKETSRELTSGNRDYILAKVSRSSDNKISSSQFGTQMMPESNMSIGHWIMSLIKLLKIPGVFELWKADLIDGFMRKDNESLFAACSPGTFSLRFSEKSAKIGVLLKTPYNGLEAWTPFSVEECRNRNLCERLMEFHELQFIRTANSESFKKEDALSRFIESKAPEEGYTERGQLAKILCSNIYLDSFGNMENNDDEMETDIFIGMPLDNDILA